MIICDKKYCIGCGTCENVCPVDACKLSYDEEGFLFPEIDKLKCINCNSCKSKCPVLLPQNKNISQEAFAYYSKDICLRKKSSSGGFFSDISQYIINEKKGVVVGAAYTDFNNTPHYVSHIIVDNIDDLQKLRGSKYVQSDMRYIFKKVKEYIDSGRIVLFSGTPCQISAIKSYIDKKDNLYTIDLFCHGVPSPKVFERYVHEMKVKKETIINFKDKINGWNDSCITFSTENCKYSARHSQDTYYLGFIENLYLRNSCYNCKYNILNNRPGDISIGDFWNIEKIIPELNDNIGINAVITNTKKGHALLKEIEHKAGFCKSMNINNLLQGNSILTKPEEAHIRRTDFFNRFNNSGNFLESARKCLNIGHNVLILNHSFSYNNYGAMMVAYSMEHIIDKLGYKPTTLLFDYPDYSIIFDNFKNKYLHTTKKYSQDNFLGLKKLSKNYDTFITGSDQVWRNWWHNSNLYRWFIDFADDSKNIISYAASFGLDYFDNKGVSNKIIKKLLCGFSAISVREKTGISICKNIFDKNATWVIDPTQLLDADDYEPIIKGDFAEPPCKDPYLTYMIFPEDENANESTYNFINNLAKELGLKAIPLLANNGEKQKTVGEWLATIKYAKFIITESFHGTMFSLIYKIPMLVLALDASEKNRLPSFFERINILQNRILYNLDYDRAVQIVHEEINWEDVDQKRNLFKDESLDFLKNAMTKRIVSNGRKKMLFYFTIKYTLMNLYRKLLNFYRQIIKKIIKKIN